MKHSAIASAALAAFVPFAAAQTKPLAITNARIEIGNGQVIERGTVVVQGGKIVSVGTAASPQDADQFDAAGLTVYPGFVDGYTSRGVSLPSGGGNVGTAPETRTQAPPSMWEGNRKGIRASVVAGDNWKISDFADYYKQGLLAGLVATGSGLIRGTASICEYRKADAVLVHNAAMEISTRSAGGGSGGTSQGYPGSLLGAIALCRQVLADAQTYGQRKNLGGNPTKDEAYEALQAALMGTQPTVMEADSDREVARSLNIADEFGLRAIVKGGRDASASGEKLKGKGVAVLLRIDYTDAPDREPKKDDPDATPKAVLEDRYAEWQKRLGNPKRLADAGVKFAFTSDGGLIDDYLGNVRRVISIGGLSREAALRAMTSDAAAILGVGDRLGTIEAGKMANLVIMNGDFASSGTVVQSVIVGGERVDVVKK